jgi:exosortase/archaeosortase family protein
MNDDADVYPLTALDALTYVALFILIAWGFTYVPSGWLERITAEVVSGTFGALGFSSSWGVEMGEAQLVLSGGARPVTVTIIRECTAINVFAVMVGLILPLKTGSWGRKLLGVVFSGLVLFLLNVSRIALTVFLTGFDVPPFSWFFTNPTIEVYHYPISFMYGVIGVALLVLMVNRWILSELGDTLLGVFESVRSLLLSRKSS